MFDSVTFGDYAHYTGKSVAFGIALTEMTAEGADFDIFGDCRAAPLIAELLLDPWVEPMRR